MIKLYCDKKECNEKLLNLRIDERGIVIECLNCGDIRRYLSK